jgi:hypothetical protein
VILTRIGGEIKHEEKYYLADFSPFQDVVDAHHKMREAKDGEFSYKRCLDNQWIDISPSEYMKTARVLRIGDGARVLSYRKRKSSDKSKSRSSSSRRNRDRRAGGSSRRK